MATNQIPTEAAQLEARARDRGFVFVSYARDDIDYVNRLVAFIQSHHIPVWYDNHLQVGARWDHEIATRIDRCAAMVLIMSPSAQASDAVAAEVDRASGRKKPIMPLLRRGEPLFGFSRVHYEDVADGAMPSQGFVANLLEFVRGSERDLFRSTTRSTRVRPSEVTWAAALYAGPDDGEPIGNGILIDERRVLTAATAALQNATVWVAFPLGPLPRALRLSARVMLPSGQHGAAFLELAQDAPRGVQPAPLRCPDEQDLLGDTFWVFGYPAGRPFGADVSGTIGDAVGYGRMRLEGQTEIAVDNRFGGAGVWSQRFGAVVGLIDYVSPQNADAATDTVAIALGQVDRDLPELQLALLARWSAAASGEDALAAWGWSLGTDQETVLHWRSKGRGASEDDDTGDRFHGRQTALSELVAWLDGPDSDGRVTIVTGSPGTGKSAVLGRIVTTADPAIRSRLRQREGEVWATRGSIACAIHAKGKTALEVGRELARAAAIRLPDSPAELAPALAARLAGHPQRGFNVIIDALDEANNPEETRRIIDQIIVPVARTCAVSGAKIVVGTRRADDGGNLIVRFGSHVSLIDLDTSRYFDEADLVDYALTTLHLSGGERPDFPYHDPEAARALATQIARLADRNYLVASLVARRHGLYDTVAANPAQLAFVPDVGAALAAYIRRILPVGEVPAHLALTALAYAGTTGFSLDVWQIALSGLGAETSSAELARFVDSSAANFLVGTAAGGHGSAVGQFRLFHQALADALVQERERLSLRQSDERAITEALIDAGQRAGWTNVDDYLLRELPHHADRVGILDQLLADDDFLLTADLSRLTPLAERSRTDTGRERARTLRLTPWATLASPAERASQFSVSQSLQHVSRVIGADSPALYRAVWTTATVRTEWAVLRGHVGRVRSVCAVRRDEATLVASAGDDTTVRLWDPATGQALRTLTGHTDWVRDLCEGIVDGRPLLASASDDGTIRLWEPTTGDCVQILSGGHSGGVTAICAVRVGSTMLLASAGDDATIRLWDIAERRVQMTLQGHTDGIRALSQFDIDGVPHLSSAGGDASTIVWDPATGRPKQIMRSETGAVGTICPLRVGNQTLLAIAGDHATVELWNPATGRRIRVLQTPNGRSAAMCAVTRDGRTMLATAGDDSSIRTWDLDNDREEGVLDGHTGGVGALCTLTVDGHELLASAGDDATVRLWDPTANGEPRESDRRRGVGAVCHVQVAETPLLASAHDDTVVRLWEPASGRLVRSMSGHSGWIGALCPVTVDGVDLIASAGGDATIRLWNPLTGETHGVLQAHLGWVGALCTTTVGDQGALVSAGGDGTVRVWNLSDGKQHKVLEGHSGWVSALASVVVDGRARIASAGDDGSVRLWDPATGELTQILDGHTDSVRSMCTVAMDGSVYLVTGGDDMTVRAWNLATGGHRTLHAHRAGVVALSASTFGDTALVASASEDAVVRLWSPHQRPPVLTIPVHHRPMSCVASPGRITVGLSDGILSIAVRPLMAPLVTEDDEQEAPSPR